MQKTNKRIGLKKALYLLLTMGFLTAVAQPLNNRKNEVNIANNPIAEKKVINSPVNNKNDKDKKREEESAAAFKEAYRVFMHPRCMNCHPRGDVASG